MATAGDDVDFKAEIAQWATPPTRLVTVLLFPGLFLIAVLLVALPPSPGRESRTVDLTHGAGPGKDEAFLPGWGVPVHRDEFDAGLEQWTVRDRSTHGSLSYDRALIGSSQVAVRNGMLTITGRRLAVPVPGSEDRPFLTGYVDSAGIFSQEYGRWEIRARLPVPPGSSQGIWPAFWLRPDNSATEGEIDIMEAYGTSASAPYGLSTRSRTQASLHFDQSGQNKTSGWTPAIPGLDTEFHVWAFEWTPAGMAWYIDGLLYKTVRREDYPAYDAAFGTGAKFHMRLNLQYGSKYWGYPDPVDPDITADLAPFDIDYVRVWALPR